MEYLKDHVVLVGGGAGQVGEGITRGLLERDATVVVPSRSREKLAALRDYVGSDLADRLVLIEDHIGTEEGAGRIREQIEADFGRLDALIASLGGWWQGVPVTKVRIETWRQILDNNLTSHFLAAKTFFPLLEKNRGSYTLITGPGSEMAVPLAGPISVASSAQRMLFRVLVVEGANSNVRMNEVVLANAHTCTRGPRMRQGAYTALELGHYLADLIVGDTHAQTIHLAERGQLQFPAQRG